VPLWRRVCPLEGLPVGRATRIEVDGTPIGVFHTADGLFAMEDHCLHAGGPLHEGELEGTTVTCPWHGWQFDVTTGRCDLNPMVALGRYPVRVRDGWIEVLAEPASDPGVPPPRSDPA